MNTIHTFHGITFNQDNDGTLFAEYQGNSVYIGKVNPGASVSFRKMSRANFYEVTFENESFTVLVDGEVRAVSGNKTGTTFCNGTVRQYVV